MADLARELARHNERTRTAQGARKDRSLSGEKREMQGVHVTNASQGNRLGGHDNQLTVLSIDNVARYNEILSQGITLASHANPLVNVSDRITNAHNRANVGVDRADNAQASADNAQTTANSGVNKANNAQTSANNAQASADNANANAEARISRAASDLNIGGTKRYTGSLQVAGVNLFRITSVDANGFIKGSLV